MHFKHKPCIAHAKHMIHWSNGHGHALPITVIDEFYLFPLSTYHIKLEALCDAEFSFIAAVMLATKPHKFSSPVLII